MVPPEKTVKVAIEELRAAVDSLGRAFEGHVEREQSSLEIKAEVRRAHEDRSRLAQELDEAQLRGNRLEEVNREVSRRLVTAMETIRAVLDR